MDIYHAPLTTAEAWLDQAKSRRRLPERLLAGRLLVSAGSTRPDTWAKTLPRLAAVTRGWAALGVRAIPGLHGTGPTGFWYSTRHWIQVTVAALAAASLSPARELFLDIEHYGSGPYPTRGEPGGNPLQPEHSCLAAMRPLLDALDARGITPWITPGGIEYAASAAVMIRSRVAYILDQATYYCPLDPLHWCNFESRRPAVEALGRHYIPGFFAAGLASADFADELTTRRIVDRWWYWRPEDAAINPLEIAE